MQNLSRRWLALAALSVTAMVGQSGCDGRQTYNVSGRVQYKDGSPIIGGIRVIRLEPTQDTTAEIRKPAGGDIAEDGSFDLFTRRPGDGVIPGSYAVVFTVLDKAMNGRSLVPPRFTRGDETPFVLEVDGNKSGLLFELEKQ